MANALYTPFKQAFLDGTGIDIDSSDVRAILIDTSAYTVNLATDDFLSDIAGGARIAVQALTSESWTAAVFDAADVTFSAVTGPSVEAVVLYIHTGTDSTSRLIAYIDTATGLPVTPNGGDITVAFDNGASKIFAV